MVGHAESLQLLRAEESVKQLRQNAAGRNFVGTVLVVLRAANICLVGLCESLSREWLPHQRLNLAQGFVPNPSDRKWVEVLQDR